MDFVLGKCGPIGMRHAFIANTSNTSRCLNNCLLGHWGFNTRNFVFDLHMTTSTLFHDSTVIGKCKMDMTKNNSIYCSDTLNSLLFVFIKKHRFIISTIHHNVHVLHSHGSNVYETCEIGSLIQAQKHPCTT